MVEEARYTLKEAMAESAAAYAEAMALGMPAAAVAAVQLRCKRNGLLVGDRKNERPPFEDYTDDELDRAIAETNRALSEAVSGKQNPARSGFALVCLQPGAPILH